MHPASPKLPQVVYFEITNRCNASCVMCPRDQLTRPSGTLSFSDFTRIVEAVRHFPLKMVSLTGYGEPFLDKNLVEKIQHAKKAGLPNVMLNTNLSLIHPQIAESVLRSGLDLLSISFYGVGKEEYESVMKGLKYERSLGNLIAYLKERKRLKLNGPLVRVRAFGWFNLVFFFDKFFGTHWSLPLLLPYLKLRRRLMKSMRYTWHNWANAKEYKRVDTEEKNRRCRFIESESLTILWNGDVITCCRDFNGEIVFGNVLKESVLQVWNQPRYRKFREDLHAGNSAAYPVCHGCDTLVPADERPSFLDLKKRLLFETA